jgi:hypothetical protein
MHRRRQPLNYRGCHHIGPLSISLKRDCKASAQEYKHFEESYGSHRALLKKRYRVISDISIVMQVQNARIDSEGKWDPVLDLIIPDFGK